MREVLRPCQTVRSLPFQSAVLILEGVQLKRRHQAESDNSSKVEVLSRAGRYGKKWNLTAYLALHEPQLLTKMAVDLEELLDLSFGGSEGTFHFHELLHSDGAVRQVWRFWALRGEITIQFDPTHTHYCTPSENPDVPWSAHLFQMLVLSPYPHRTRHCHNQADPSLNFHCNDGSQCPSELTPHYLGRNKEWTLNFMHYTVHDKRKKPRPRLITFEIIRRISLLTTLGIS